MSKAFSILKIPVSREKQVLYYYKPYDPATCQSQSQSIVDPPPADRTMYVVHFLQPIEEHFILKNFSHAGKIKKTIIGEFKPKVSRRAHKKTMYFALIVFKKAESLALLSESKFL